MSKPVHFMLASLIAIAVVALTINADLSVAAQETKASDKDSKEPVPEKYRVKFETTKGDFVIEVTRKWSPAGADHFHQLVKSGFYNDCGFFRVLPGFMVQFGINGDPKVQAKRGEATIKDDPVVESNKRGYVTYAKTGRPNSRSTQLFINFGDNARLDNQGFSPFGKVVEGMKVVDSINSEYKQQPSQALIKRSGNEYLKQRFPKLDYIKKASIVKEKTEEK